MAASHILSVRCHGYNCLFILIEGCLLNTENDGSIITPRACARGKVIGRVVIVNHTKIATTRLLGVSVSVQYGHNVEYAKK